MGTRSFDIMNVALFVGRGRLNGLISHADCRRSCCSSLSPRWRGIAAPLLGANLAIRRYADDDRSDLRFVVGRRCGVRYRCGAQAKFHRLAALIMVGGVGLVTCLTFAWFSAPDLALTQIAVEVVTLVLIAAGIEMAPRRVRAR